MARDLNITASSMTYYESGLAVPSVDKLYAIADYLYTSIDYLVGRIDKSIESIQTEKMRQNSSQDWLTLKETT